MGLVKKWRFFSLDKIGQENVFHHILERKEVLSRL